MSIVSRFLKEGSEKTLFGKGYDAQFERDGKTPPPCDEGDVQVWRDVSYDSDGSTDPRRRMDVFRPKGREGAVLPVFVFFHGGGWRAGDKSDDSHVYENLSVELAGRDWVVANANYRLAPEADWRVQAADVAKAIGFMACEAERFGGDGTRIVISGHSSGGHLVALVSLNPAWLKDANVPSESVRGVAPISGVFDIADFATSSQNLRWMVKPAFGMNEAEWADASPISWAGSQAPSFYIVIGEHDESRIAGQADRLGALLDEAGVPNAVVSMPEADHFSVLAHVGEPDYQLVDYLATFADTVVGGARAERDYEAAEETAREEIHEDVRAE